MSILLFGIDGGIEDGDALLQIGVGGIGQVELDLFLVEAVFPDGQLIQLLAVGIGLPLAVDA